MGGWTNNNKDTINWDGTISVNNLDASEDNHLITRWFSNNNYLKLDGSNANTEIDLQGQNLVNVNTLGIATTSPNYTLDVDGTINTRDGIIRGRSQVLFNWGGHGTSLNVGSTSGASNNAGLIFYSDGTLTGKMDNTELRYYRDNGQLNFSSSTGTKTIVTGGTTHLNLAPGGHVGIGSTSPPRQLTLNHATEDVLGFYIGGAEEALLRVSNNNQLRVEASAGLKVNSTIFSTAPQGEVQIDSTNTANSSVLRFKINGVEKATHRANNAGSWFIETGGSNTRFLIDSSGSSFIGDGGLTNYTEISSTGDVVFVGGAGLAFGEIYAYDTNTTITISGTGIANKVQVTAFDTNGASNNTTPDHTNDHITITKAGIYKCDISCSISSGAGAAFKVGAGVFKNNGATHFTNLHFHRNLSGGGGDTGSASMTGLIDLAVNDTIEVWAWNETNTTNLIVDDITLNLVQVGGT